MQCGGVAYRLKYNGKVKSEDRAIVLAAIQPTHDMLNPVGGGGQPTIT